MKKLFCCANQYIISSNWKDMALLKICLCSIGVIIGLTVTSDKKKPWFIFSFLAFLATYIPLMARFLKSICKKSASC